MATPRRFLLGVATWQALGRLLRLGSLVCFLTAFALPATLGAAVLVMAAQGGGRIIPIAPLSAGLRIAMLSYGLVEVTGRPVDAAAVTVFTFGVGAVLFIVMLTISLVLVGREFGVWSPRAGLRKARRQPRPSSGGGQLAGHGQLLVTRHSGGLAVQEPSGSRQA